MIVVLSHGNIKEVSLPVSVGVVVSALDPESNSAGLSLGRARINPIVLASKTQSLFLPSCINGYWQI